MDIVGFEGYYQISSFGRLKSFKTSQNGIILQNNNSRDDYLRVVLQGIGKSRKTAYIHRLVAEHFIENPSGFNVVNHIDSNKQNNVIDNLEWCTQKHNINHSIQRNPNQLRGLFYHNMIIRPNKICQLDRSGKLISIFPTAHLASIKTGVCERNILQVAHKEHMRKTAGGFVWRFEREVMGND